MPRLKLMLDYNGLRGF